MNLLRILTVTAVSATLIGCASTDSGNSPARARTSQLREGMTQGQVRAIFGQPDKVDHDDGYHRGYGVPYYGWRGYGDGEPELTWEYRNPELEVTFRRGRSGGWVVKEWDN